MGEVVENNTTPIDAPSRLPDYASPVPRPETNLKNPIARVFCGTLHTILVGIVAGAITGGALGVSLAASGSLTGPDNRPASFTEFVTSLCSSALLGSVMGISVAVRFSFFCGIFTFVCLEFVTGNALKPSAVFWQSVKGMRKAASFFVPAGAVLGLVASTIVTHSNLQIPKIDLMIRIGPKLGLMNGYMLGVIISFLLGCFSGAMWRAAKEVRRQRSLDAEV